MTERETKLFWQCFDDAAKELHELVQQMQLVSMQKPICLTVWRRLHEQLIDCADTCEGMQELIAKSIFGIVFSDVPDRGNFPP